MSPMMTTPSLPLLGVGRGGLLLLLLRQPSHQNACFPPPILAPPPPTATRSRSCLPLVLAADPASPRPRSSLADLCHTLELCFFEVCVRNLGRPAGLALHDFVSATVKSFLNGYSREQISLQIMFGSTGMREFELGTAGSRLTATEEHYRSKWLDTIYITLKMLKVADNEASRSATTDDRQLYSTIYRVIEGQKWGDEQSVISFDRGLATRGASGGMVTGKVVIAPQWVPVSQIVLLTMKVVNDSKL